MSKAPPKVVLFLGPAADDRARAAATAFNAVAARMGLRWTAVARGPADADATADRVVAVTRDVEPQLGDREVEYWHLTPGDIAAVEKEVMGFVTRLLGGRMDAPPDPPPAPPPLKKVLTAKVGRETAGRKGKGVTTVFDLDVSDAELQELAAKLKQRCGTGGTAKDGRIEIQGDNRDRVVVELEKLGFRVKRAGG